MFVYVVLLLIACTSRTAGIATIHHDKPETATIPKMVEKMTEEQPQQESDILNVTLSPSERQKRLLPYENFYLTQPESKPQLETLYPITGQANQRYQFDRPPPKKQYVQYEDYNQNLPDEQDLYVGNTKFTPFSENNAIPGPFRPIIPNHPPQKFKIQYVQVSEPQQHKLIDYGSIYEKLAQLKFQSRRPSYTTQTYQQPPQPQRYIQSTKPEVSYVPERQRYKIQPTKTIIQTFTATNIDIPSGSGEEYAPVQSASLKTYENQDKFYKYQEDTKPYVNQHVAIEIPQGSYAQENFQPILVQKVYQGPKQIVRKPYIVIPRPEGQDQEQFLRKPVVVIQRKPNYRHKPVHQQQQQEYVRVQKPIYQIKPVYQQPQEYTTDLPEVVTPNYEPQYMTPKYQEYQTVSPVTTITENYSGLSQILKQLQDTNTLPKTLTPNNIDNSIKTLVRILEALRKQQKFSRPIVVPDESGESEGDEGSEEEVPGTVTQSFPVDTPDGGTPGKAGVDYPALSSIPQTSFNCKTQRYKGFFGDPDTNCQVWHYCDLNGGQASFLCPNGTIFSQVALTCDWWYNVKCSSTAQLYVLNERLYKYIIPLSPKFPEDYSGPLVDKYLALKFQEMEEKMKKEKKGKGKKPDEDKENEELQNIEDVASSNREEKPSTVTQGRETLETIENDNNQE